jgi:hypothetical protein
VFDLPQNLFIDHNVVVGKRNACTLLNEMTRSYYAYGYGRKDNLCWFAIPAYYNHYQILDEPTRMHPKIVSSQARKNFARFTGIITENESYNSKKKSIAKAVDEYRGFTLSDESVNEFMEFFDIPGIRTFIYDSSHKRCVFSKEYNQNPDNNVFCNVAVVNLGDGIHHAVYLKDVDAAIGLAVCPKCKKVYDAKPNEPGKRTGKRSGRRTNTNYQCHVDECTGEKTEKELRVRKREQVYCPGITNNKQYQYLRARGREAEFKSTNYYIVADVETVERPYDGENKSDSTTISGILEVISIASIAKLKSGNVARTYSIKDNPDFIDKWIEDMFKFAETIVEDNHYILNIT